MPSVGYEKYTSHYNTTLLYRKIDSEIYADEPLQQPMLRLVRILLL